MPRSGFSTHYTVNWIFSSAADYNDRCRWSVLRLKHNLSFILFALVGMREREGKNTLKRWNCMFNVILWARALRVSVHCTQIKWKSPSQKKKKWCTFSRESKSILPSSYFMFCPLSISSRLQPKLNSSRLPLKTKFIFSTHTIREVNRVAAARPIHISWMVKMFSFEKRSCILVVT